MAELTPNSRGNGYEHSSTSKNEEVIISVPQQASSRASHFSRHYCIQKVPDFLRGEEHNTRDYDPAVVSFGPYHHGKAKLKLAEDFKPKALEFFVAESGKDADFYYYKVAEVIHDVRRCYLENSTGEYDDAVFARMMLLDASVIINHIWMILEFNRLSEATINPHEVIENTITEVEMFKATIDHLGLLVFRFFHRDMFLLENQIPLWLLKRLINLKYGKDRGKEMLNKFFSIFGGEYMQPGESKTEMEPPHLLAAFRRILVADWKKGVETRSGWSVFECFPKREKLKPVRNTKKYFRSFSSVTDLKAKGIHFSRSSTASLTDINFKSSYFHGQLQLPTWYVSIHTKAIFRNLVAFEMCPNILRNTCSIDK